MTLTPATFGHSYDFKGEELLPGQQVLAAHGGSLISGQVRAVLSQGRVAITVVNPGTSELKPLQTLQLPGTACQSGYFFEE